MPTYRKQQPLFFNISEDPKLPLVLPFNRAARKRYAKAKGVTLAEVPALNKPIINKPKPATEADIAKFMADNKELFDDLIKKGD